MTQPTPTETQPIQIDTQPTEEAAAPKPAKEYPKYAENDRVYVNRGKHRGQEATVVLVAENDTYGVKLDSGLTVVMSAASFRTPDAPALTAGALSAVFAEVRLSLAPPQRKALDTLASAVDETFAGFREAYDAAVDASQPVAV